MDHLPGPSLYEIELYGNPINEPAQAWADWLCKTEQYLLQEHPWAVQGRGANLQAVTKPLVPTKTGQTWKKGKPAYWEQLKVRFQLAQKQPATTNKGRSRVSRRPPMTCASIGWGRRHGANSWTRVTIGTSIVIHAQLTS